ncbi:MAG: hypothetical protein ACO4CU_12850, partial [Ilumatobacteraceae bacterium]
MTTPASPTLNAVSIEAAAGTVEVAGTVDVDGIDEVAATVVEEGVCGGAIVGAGSVEPVERGTTESDDDLV